MKNNIVVLALLLLPVFCLAQNATEEKTIFKGEADTIYNGAKVVIYNRAPGYAVHDSAYVANGKFQLTVPYSQPTMYMFYSEFESKKKKGYAPWGILVTKPGIIKLKADLESISKTKVTGSAENDLYQKYLAETKIAEEKFSVGLKQKYGEEFLKKQDRKDPKFQEFVFDWNRFDSANVEEFIHKNPGSFTSIFLLDRNLKKLGTAKAEELYNTLSENYKKSSIAQKIASRIDATKITAMGKVAPDFEQADTAGNTVKLSAFRGKYVLLDFWASWCVPCRKENPNVVKAYEKYKDNGFTVLGISLDNANAKTAWLKAIEKDNIGRWPQVSDLKGWDNQVAKLYGIDAIPRNFLLDKEGKIIGRDLVGEELQKKLEELFIRDGAVEKLSSAADNKTK